MNAITTTSDIMSINDKFNTRDQLNVALLANYGQIIATSRELYI
jgi:hypothetical protein